MSKKCVKCGQLLPEDASFCPHCTAVQTKKQEIKTPRRWKKKAATALTAVVIAAAAGAAVSMYHRPKAYEGSAKIIYPGKDKSYKILLSFSSGEGVTGHAQGERTDTIAEGMESALPCQLYVFDEENGELAGEEFADLVASCRVDAVPQDGAQKMQYVEPVYNASFPDAAYTSDISYSAASGTNDILWDLTMKNGDTISLSTRLTIEKQEVVTYFAEDTPMETTEELNALLASIEEEVPSDTPVYLHLPAVTYDGPVSFGNHVFGIYGSTEGEAVTTFAQTVSMRGLNGNYADLYGIRFAGESGTGLNAYCLVMLSECSFDGWDTAAVAQNGAWIGADACTFTNNGTALKFCTSSAYGTAPSYLNNTFTGNGTAVCIDSLPGKEVLDFAGSIFSENEVDIDNKAEHPVDTAKAAFE